MVLKQEMEVDPGLSPSILGDETISIEQSESSIHISASNYPYTQLESNSIRLIILEPKCDDEDEAIIRCSLIHKRFAEKPRYDALSYTWGDEEPAVDIFIGDYSMRVRANLYLALKHLRQDQPRTLWADAICIDQSNTSERNTQVGIMDTIYQRAITVRIWLGCESPVNSLPQVSSEELTWFPRKTLLNLDYWHRAWIVQEIGLSNNLCVHVGKASMSWDSFINDKLSMPGIAQEDKVQILKLDSKRRGRHSNANRLELLLEDFQDCRCKESRDQIFAFLGLAWDCDDLVKADYSKLLCEIYDDLIYFFCRRKTLTQGVMNEFDRSMKVVKFSQMVHKLLGNITRPPLLLQRTSVVGLAGAIGGTVLQLGPTYDLLFSYPMAEKLWKRSFTSLHYNSPTDTTHLRKSYESYYHVLHDFDPQNLSKYVGFNPRDLYSRAEPDSGNKVWESNETHWSHPKSGTIFRKETRDLEDSPSIKIDHSTEQPHLFLGTNYLMGLVPPQARAGDLICHFWKCDVVALLRKEDVTNVYRIIGRVHLSTGSLSDDLIPKYVPWVEPHEGSKLIHIQLDIDTLHYLTR